jgi:hypothetical protein
MSEFEFQKRWRLICASSIFQINYLIAWTIIAVRQPEALSHPIWQFMSFITLLCTLVVADIWLSMMPTVIHKYKLRRSGDD